MHPTARRCVWGAVVLWIAGASLVGVAPTLYDLADGWLGGAVGIAVGFLQEALVPTGAVLLGAAVVVQALSGTRSSSGAADVAPGAAPGAGTPRTGAMPTVGPPTGTTPTAPLAPPSSAAPPVQRSGAAPSVPSRPVPALSGPVPTAGPVTGATQAAEDPARGGRRPRSRRNR